MNTHTRTYIQKIHVDLYKNFCLIILKVITFLAWNTLLFSLMVMANAQVFIQNLFKYILELEAAYKHKHVHINICMLIPYAVQTCHGLKYFIQETIAAWDLIFLFPLTRLLCGPVQTFGFTDTHGNMCNCLGL